jgi:small neutral amino acid transporter SnatA (MarC family)
VDFLVALVLRNWILKELGSEIAVFDIMGGISIADMGSLLVERKGTKVH